MTPEERAIEALAEVLPSREVTALALEYQLDAAKHGTWRGRQQAQEAVAAAIWSRIDRDALRAALLADVRREVEELMTHEFIDSYEQGTTWLAVDRGDVLRLLGD